MTSFLRMEIAESLHYVTRRVVYFMFASLRLEVIPVKGWFRLIGSLAALISKIISHD